MVSIYLWWVKKTCKVVDILLECILCVKNLVFLLFIGYHGFLQVPWL